MNLMYLEKGIESFYLSFGNIPVYVKKDLLMQIPFYTTSAITFAFFTQCQSRKERGRRNCLGFWNRVKLE